MPNSASRLLLLAFGLLFLFACGQRGPLYLPDNPPPNLGKNLCPTCSPVAEGKPDENVEEDKIEGDTDAADEGGAEADNNKEQPDASPQETSDTIPNESNE